MVKHAWSCSRRPFPHAPAPLAVPLQLSLAWQGCQRGDGEITWNNEGVDATQLLLGAHFHSLHIGKPPQAGHVLPEGALQRQNADAHMPCHC